MARRKAGDKQVNVGDLTDISGEVNIASGDITRNIKIIQQRALTAGEEAARARKQESKLLAQGIAALVQNLFNQISQGIQNENPYKGLLPYSLNEAEIFYGRDKARKDLLVHIKQSSLTVLHAESGAGKSSLLQAGIAAQLIANGHLAVYLRPYHADPVEFIKRMFLPELTQAPALARASLREFLRQVCAVLGPKVSLYLLLDQFEEFFQLKRDERQPFLEALADCLNDPSLNVRWVLALRKEALSDLAELESYGITQFKNTYRLDRLSRAEAQEAITKPAGRHGIKFEPALTEHILDTLTTNDEIRPTHLQLICSALTDDLPEEKTLTLAYYTEHEGGTERILRDYLKRQLEDLPASEQILAWKVLRALITADRHRALKTYDEIIQELNTSGVSKKQIETILGRLVERRLLFTQTQPAAEEVFELAHDYLIKEIELDPQEQALKAAQELLDQETRAYQRHKTLLTPERLEVIAPYQDELHFSAEAKALFRESQKAMQAERRARERRRNLTLGISVAVAIGMSLLAVWGFRSSQISRANELAAQSVALRDKDFRMSLLLGIEAFRLQDTVQTRGALMDAANAKPQLKQFISSFKSNIYTVAFSPDGKSLASGGCGKYIDGRCTQGEIIIWDVASRQRIGQPITGHTSVAGSVTFSPNGKLLASAGWDGSIILWNAATREPIGQPLLGHTIYVSSLAFRPDGKVIASASLDGSIILWDVASGQRIGQPLGEHTGSILSVAFRPDGNMLASANWDGSISLWDVASQRRFDPPLTGHRKPVSSIAFSPDGSTLASGSEDGTIILWNVTSHQQIGQPLARHTDEVRSVAFSKDGKILASGSFDNTIILWDVATHQTIGPPLSGGASGVYSVAFRSDGKTLASASGGLNLEGSITLWDITSHVAAGQSIAVNSFTNFNASFSPDGKILAFGGCEEADPNTHCKQGEILLWDIAKRKFVGKPLRAGTYGLDSLAFSPDGKTLTSGDIDGTIIWWDVASQQPIQTFKKDDHGIAFSPDGKVLASTSDTSISLWDAKTHVDLGQLPMERGLVIAFRPDGKILAAANTDSDIILWNVAKRQRIGLPLTGHIRGSLITSIVFSPDGKTLASGGEDPTIFLWDVASHAIIGRLGGHTDVVDSLAFTPDGRTLASSSADSSIILWDVASRQPIGEPLIGHTSLIPSIAFSPDGKTLVSSSDDQTIVLWNLSTDSWEEQSCKRAGSNFTRIEWKRYFPNEKYRRTCDQWPPAPESTPVPSAAP